MISGVRRSLPLDAARQALDEDLRHRRPDLAHFDGELFAGRVRLAEQGVAVAFFIRHQSQRPAVRIAHFAVTNARATRRAVSALAAMRKIQSGAQRGVENGLTAFNGEDLLRWQQCDAGIGPSGGHDRA